MLAGGQGAMGVGEGGELPFLQVGGASAEPHTTTKLLPPYIQRIQSEGCLSVCQYPTVSASVGGGRLRAVMLKTIFEYQAEQRWQSCVPFHSLLRGIWSERFVPAAHHGFDLESRV